MFKPISRLSLLVGISLVVFGVGIGRMTSSADASTGSRACEMKWAKGATVFPAGTEFSLKKGFATYTYKCEGDSGLWWESVYQLPRPVGAGNAGVLSADDSTPPPSGPGSGGGVVLQ